MEGKENKFFCLFGYPWKIQGKVIRNSFPLFGELKKILRKI